MDAYKPEDNRIRHATIKRIIDGDTVIVTADLLFKTSRDVWLRFSGLDTPEVRGPEREAGLYVERQLTEFLGDGPVTFFSSSLDQYDRSIAMVWNCDGQCVNAWLLDSGLAWRTDDKGHVIGPRTLDRLLLPDAIRRKCAENLL